MVKKKSNAKFEKGDHVVYPSYGPGKILAIKKEIIAGKRIKVLVIQINERVILRVPEEKIKDLGLRKLSTANRLKDALTVLKAKQKKKKKTMWSRRAQEYEAKISSGKIYELAEVVRDLNKGDDLMIDQSYSERQLFEKAYDRLLTEFQIVLNTSLEDTQKKIDKALKRNLEIQKSKIDKKLEKETKKEEINTINTEAVSEQLG